MAYLTTQIDTTNLTRLAELLERDNRARAANSQEARHIHQGLDAAGAVYMGFTRDRYSRFSRGEGNWPDLAPSTLARRRKGQDTQGARHASQSARILSRRGVAPVTAAILIDTATLINSIGGDGGGYAQEQIVAGIRVGTEIQYAVYHQEGGANGRPPQREIFVEPDPQTAAIMQRAIEIGYQRAVDAYGART